MVRDGRATFHVSRRGRSPQVDCTDAAHGGGSKARARRRFPRGYSGEDTRRGESVPVRPAKARCGAHTTRRREVRARDDGRAYAFSGTSRWAALKRSGRRQLGQAAGAPGPTDGSSNGWRHAGQVQEKKFITRLRPNRRSSTVAVRRLARVGVTTS